MILSGSSIQKLLDDGLLKVHPEALVKEASIKIHLSNKFSNIGQEFVEQDEYVLKPGEFIVARSKEKIFMPDNYAGLYDGYTHLARKGVMTHMGSMFVDPGSELQITLEIYNTSNTEVVLQAGDRVGHLIILEVK